MKSFSDWIALRESAESPFKIGDMYKQRVLQVVDQLVKAQQTAMQQAQGREPKHQQLILSMLKGANALKQKIQQVVVNSDNPGGLHPEFKKALQAWQQERGGEVSIPGIKEVENYLTQPPADLSKQFNDTYRNLTPKQRQQIANQQQQYLAQQKPAAGTTVSQPKPAGTPAATPGAAPKGPPPLPGATPGTPPAAPPAATPAPPVARPAPAAAPPKKSWFGGMFG